MSTPPGHQRWARAALAAGLPLFLLALAQTDWAFLAASGARLLIAVVAAIAVGGAWHLPRTLSWARCFPPSQVPSRSRLFRVRLAAEAVSYVTLRGITDEPLKVLLLADRVDARTATAAVALERAAYVAVTTAIVGASAIVAILRLDLTPAWTLVFRGFAVTSAVVAGVTAAVITGRGRYLGRLRRVGRSGSIVAKVGGFVADVEERLLFLLWSERRRLLVLATWTSASYLLMATEAWVVFAAVGTPITLTRALAIETFTRVASFASAVIPANLGALEAASLAAAAAVGGPAGAVLAVARRARGLFWAGARFAVYPCAPERATRDASRVPRGQDGPTLLYVAEEPRVDVPPSLRLAGLGIAERVVRAACRAGYQRVVVLASSSRLGGLERLDAGVAVVSDVYGLRRALVRDEADAWLTVLGPGLVVSPALLSQAARVEQAAGVFADVPASPLHPVSGVVRTTVRVARDATRLADIAVGAVWRADPLPSGEAVSRNAALLAIRVVTPSGAGAAERTLRQSVYKYTDATLARFNRRFSLPLSVALVPTAVTPNLLSTFIVVLGFASAWFFARGEYVAGVIGAVLSLTASVLDGCDGELARLTYEESSLGCWIETLGHYSHYLAIFTGLTVGAVHPTGSTIFLTVGALSLVGTVVSFVLLIFLRRRITAGRPETLHAVAKARFTRAPTRWSRVVWRLSFVATREAMP